MRIDVILTILTIIIIKYRLIIIIVYSCCCLFQLLVGISACIKFNQMEQSGYEPIEDSEQPLQQETGASTVEADKLAALGASMDSKKSQTNASLISSGRYQHPQLHPE